MYNKEQFILDLTKLISYKSVLGSPEKDMPFGKSCYEVLKCFLDIAKGFGFEVKNYDNYIGEVTFGEGEELGIIGHLDVVPEGSGWNTNPYNLTLVDGVYYGRGILDDKGPLLMALYVLKELKDKGIKPNRKFRLFVGVNEETGWKDVEYFSTHYGFPEYGFSPDGNFPVSYAEKAMAIITFKLPKLKNYIVEKSGTVVNAVCGVASAIDKNGNRIEKIGKSCHGSCPQNGVNAIKLLFEEFLDNGEDVKNILDYFFYDKAEIFKMKNEQGGVTFSPDLIEEKNDGIYLTCDCRFPYPITEKDIRSKFNEFGYPYNFMLKHPTQFVDKNSFLVSALINAYNGVMASKEAPVSQSGTTFARVFKRGVAFGPEFPFSPSTIHQPNECVSDADLEKMFEIYKKAILDLATK